MYVTVFLGLYVFYLFWAASSLGVSLFWQPATCHINIVFINIVNCHMSFLIGGLLELSLYL